MNDEQLSKRLAYLLRHAPDQAGITLEPGGWAPLAPLLAHLRVSRARVEQVVAADRKGRYVLRGDRIRANQGHSVAVDLHLTLTRPPQTLYHGTHTGALDAIRREGLIRIPLHSCTVGPIQLGRRRLCIHIAESVFFPTRIRSAAQLCKSD